MDEFKTILEAAKGFGGYINAGVTISLALLAYWRGLPAIIEAGGKIIEVWSNRAASIEDRLQTSMRLTLERYDKQIEAADKRATDMEDRYAESEKRHNECEDKYRAMSRQVDSLNDQLFLVKQDLTGAKRQLAQYEAHGGAVLPVSGAVFIPQPITPNS